MSSSFEPILDVGTDQARAQEDGKGPRGNELQILAQGAVWLQCFCAVHEGAGGNGWLELLYVLMSGCEWEEFHSSW